MHVPLPTLPLLASLPLTLSSLHPTHALPASSAPPLPCNGHPSLCTRPYSNITFLGTHDSPFVGASPADNQLLPLTAQLDAGIRFLQAQTHANSSKTLSLCHTSCFLNDAGSLTSFLSTVKTWLDKHPKEVVTLLLTNGDRLPPARFADAFTAAGADGYAFVPASSSSSSTTTTTTTAPLAMDQWPTLGELIAHNTRLVTFLDYGAGSSPPAVPYILDQFTHFFETAFDATSPSALADECAVDRPSKDTKPEGRMYVFNHYLDVEVKAPADVDGFLGNLGGLGGLFGKRHGRRKGKGKAEKGKRGEPTILVPDRGAAAKTNGAESVGEQVGVCEGLYGRRPNAVLLDFVGEGVVADVQARLNGL